MIYYDQVEFSKTAPRPGWTYRGARRNADRQDAKWKAHKANRRELGMTRAQYDIWCSPKQYSERLIEAVHKYAEGQGPAIFETIRKAWFEND